MLEFHISLRNIEVLACLLTFPKGFEDQKSKLASVLISNIKKRGLTNNNKAAGL